MTQHNALIAGATGIVGLNLASHLAKQKEWRVYGLARNPISSPGVQPMAADLLQPDSLTAALQDVQPTHVFITSWMRQPTEAENIRVNSAIVRNLLDVLSRSRSVKHVALVTGLKHYLGPF
jgi:nucleoside-diphosphate-sugar epimerase